MKMPRRTTAFCILIWILAAPLPAMATQGHGHPEGLYAHQMAHIFFMFSMGLLIYWLRRRHLTQEAGWRYIQYASLFIILWNIDAFIVHFIEEQLDFLEVVRTSPWQLEIRSAPQHLWLTIVYYIVKLDHLLCVPALLFLYLGLKRLLSAGGKASGHVTS